MKLFGYELDSDKEVPLQLEEVSIQATPEEMSQLSLFFAHAAKALESVERNSGHEHFSDFIGVAKTKQKCELIVST